MLFSTAKDWKEFLTTEDEEELNNILKRISKYRGAYKNADDIKLAQLWCSILELRKENLILKKKLARIEEVFENMFSKVFEQEKERRDLAKSLENF